MNNKKIIIKIVVLFILILFFTFLFFDKKNIILENVTINNENSIDINKNMITEESNNGSLSSINDLFLKDIDGQKKNYIFIYKEEKFEASYTKDNWHIENSYKITNKNDIAIICKALTDIHPIHGKDMSSYRTIDDLVYEWLQHNIAYNFLSENSQWKDNVRSVDLDPEDQGKTIEEMYEARTGKKLNLKDIK